MLHSDVISTAGGWEGYRVASTQTIGSGDQKRLEVELVLLADREMFCCMCGQRCTTVHETTKRSARSADTGCADTSYRASPRTGMPTVRANA